MWIRTDQYFYAYGNNVVFCHVNSPSTCLTFISTGQETGLITFTRRDVCNAATIAAGNDPGYVDIDHERVDYGICYSCPAGTKRNAAGNGCTRYVDRYFDKPNDICSNPGFGNPIYPLTGVKRQDVDVGVRIGDQALTLTYDTRSKIPGAADLSLWNIPARASFGPLWQSSLHKSMVLQSSAGPGSAYSSVVAQRGGALSTAGVAGFDSCSSGGGSSSAYIPTTERTQRITYSGSAGRLVDGKALSEENYDASGAVQSVVSARGVKLTYTYSAASTPASIAPSAGLLIQISDPFGRSIQFTYEQAADTSLPPRILTITDPNGKTIRASYDTLGNLRSLQWPDGAVRTFLYERTDLPWALTGMQDENQQRYATYSYDNAGRANSTELANGVDKYTVSYSNSSSAPSWSVTETVVNNNLICREHRWVAPSGTSVTGPTGYANGMSASIINGMVGLSTQSQPPGACCAASTAAQDYDANGNVSRYDDFNGNRSCYAYDLSRNLRTISLEGLPNTIGCLTPQTQAAPNALLPRSGTPTGALRRAAPSPRSSPPGSTTASPIRPRVMPSPPVLRRMPWSTASPLSWCASRWSKPPVTTPVARASAPPQSARQWSSAGPTTAGARCSPPMARAPTTPAARTTSPPTSTTPTPRPTGPWGI
jgi:YD repeat-containing protein